MFLRYSGHDYLLDAEQQLMLFRDILRKCGNNYFQTIKNGDTPVLNFDDEIRSVYGNFLDPCPV